MGYLLLAAALFAGVTKGYCGKKTSGYVNRFQDAVLANTIRMAVCIIIGFILVVVQDGISALKTDSTTMVIAVLSGAASAVFVVSWLLAVKTGAYMMLDVFLMLGTIIPLAGSSLLFQEEIRATQWLGLGILMAAVLLMCSYNNTIKNRLTWQAVGMLLLCGAANGAADFSQKLFVEYTSGSAAVFNLYTYLFAGIMLLSVYGLAPGEKKTVADTAGFRKMLIYIPVMAVCLFANSFFKTMAAAYLPSAQLYPLTQGAGLILSAMMSAVLFRERLTGKCILGLLLAFTALLIINVL